MKRLIKYSALLFALILSASIIGGCLTFCVSLAQGLVDEFSYPEELEGKDNSIWHRDEEGNVYFLGTKFADDVQVMSGSEQFSMDDISSLDINVGSVGLLVDVWDNDMISVEYENVPVEYKFYVNNNTLVIEREDSFSFIWNVSFTESPKIHVSVPASMVFDKVEIDNGAGGVGLSNVTAKKLLVDSGSGGVTISDSKAEKSVFNSGSGSFVVKNCELGVNSMDSGSGTVIFEDIVAKNMMLETGSGRADVSGVITGKCEFESGSGSLNVVVYGHEEDYNVRTDMGSGGFYLNGKKKDNDYDKGDKRAKYLLDFEAGSGRVSLEFDESKVINTDNTQSGENYER